MKYLQFKKICVLFTVFFVVSCSDDFLDRPSLSEISPENFYQTKEQMRLATAGLYGGRIWAQWNNDAYIPIGDILSGNIIYSLTRLRFQELTIVY